MFTAFKLLAKLRFLRGGPLDVFGRTDERRTERKLIEDYAKQIDELLTKLTPENHALAVQIRLDPRGDPRVWSRQGASSACGQAERGEAARGLPRTAGRARRGVTSWTPASAG